MKSGKLCLNLPIFRFCALPQKSDCFTPQKKKQKFHILFCFMIKFFLKQPKTLKNKKHGNPNSAEFFYFTFTDLTIYSKFLNSEHIH